MDIKCTYWEDTGRMTEFINGVSSTIYKNVVTGEESSSLPVGAMRYMPDDYIGSWPSHYLAGPDGKCLIVKTPGGDWIIDSKASNCTKPDDPTHRCWCRHGTPPNITVNKTGNTCSAGAGSIFMSGYHAYLRNGILVDC